MKSIFRYYIFALFFILGFIKSVAAAEFLIEDLTRHKNKQKAWIALPYAFSSDSMGLTVGAVGMWSGYIQPQVSIVGTVFMGEELDIKHGDLAISEKKRAQGVLLGISGYKPFFSERIFITALGGYSYFPNQRIYINGSNDSVKEIENSHDTSLTPVQTQGYSAWFLSDFRYVLPWGESKNTVLPHIQLRRGIPVNRDNIGGGVPFVTGQTILGTELFYNNKTIEKFTEHPEINSNGMRFYLEHDNTDYGSNPTRGYTFKGQISADFGLGKSTQSWTSLELDYSHFIELPNFSWSRQSVIALNTWTAYSPSWDKSEDFSAYLNKHQTPMWEGARLGGWNRMRGYDSNRFNDKAAIYGAAEYRVIPTLNPLEDQEWNPIAIDWFQVVLFAEVGRVAPKYDVSELFTDMKYDVGFSFRALAAKLPIRFDMAFSEEGTNMWFMINQPF